MVIYFGNNDKTKQRVCKTDSKPVSGKLAKAEQSILVAIQHVVFSLCFLFFDSWCYSKITFKAGKAKEFKQCPDSKLQNMIKTQQQGDTLSLFH